MLQVPVLLEGVCFCLPLQWTTLSFKGPVQPLSELFEEILTKLKPANSRTTGATPSTPPSPALPVVSAIHLRLLLLRPDHTHLVRFEEGAEATANESKLMYCEAIRRLSLSKWPHKDYVYVNQLLVFVWSTMNSLNVVVRYVMHIPIVDGQCPRQWPQLVSTTWYVHLADTQLPVFYCTLSPLPSPV